MIQSSRNAEANASNKYQGNSVKVLCVCSAGALRSPTLANVLYIEYGYNTRSCGSDDNFALIPLSTALIEWADIVVFVHCDCLPDPEVLDFIRERVNIRTLDIPDHYDWDDNTLKRICKEQWESRT